MKLPPVQAGARRLKAAGLIVAGLVLSGLSLAAVSAFDHLASAKFATAIPLLVLVLVTIAGIVLRVVQRRLGEQLALSYVSDLRAALLRNVLDQPHPTPELRLGLVTSRLGSDLLAVKTWLSDGLSVAVVTTVFLTGLMVGVAFLYPAIALMLGVVIGIWVLGVLLLRGHLRKAIADVRRQRGRLAALAGDQVVSRMTIRHFGRTGAELRKLGASTAKLNRGLVRRATLSELMRTSADLALPVAAIGCFALGSAAGFAIAPLLLVMSLVATELGRLSRAVDLYQGYAVARDKLSRVLESQSVKPADVLTVIPFNRGRARSIGIDYSAGTNGPVTLAVPAGACAVLTGGTAADRSRILMVLAQLQQASDVSVRLDELSPSGIGDADWKRSVTLVSPLLPLVRGTIRRNIELGMPSSTEPAYVDEVAARLGLASCEGGLENPCGPETVGDLALRIRLARAILRHTGVVLVDDHAMPGAIGAMAEALAMLRSRNATIIVAGDWPLAEAPPSLMRLNIAPDHAHLTLVRKAVS